jgi:hypothetical protein
LILFIKKIIYNNGVGINQKMLFIYNSSYENASSLKIEILNGVTYLNGYTIQQFIKKILISHPNLDQQACFNIIKTVQVQLNGFLQFENEDEERLQFYMASIKINEKDHIPFMHPAYL